MGKIKKISVAHCCTHYKIETSFVLQLGNYGLIELTRSGKNAYIAYEQLADLERYIHFHYDLEINMEGMEAIRHLLTRMENLQQEIKTLKRELGKSQGPV